MHNRKYSDFRTTKPPNAQTALKQNSKAFDVKSSKIKKFVKISKGNEAKSLLKIQIDSIKPNHQRSGCRTERSRHKKRQKRPKRFLQSRKKKENNPRNNYNANQPKTNWQHKLDIIRRKFGCRSYARHKEEHAPGTPNGLKMEHTPRKKRKMNFSRKKNRNKNHIRTGTAAKSGLGTRRRLKQHKNYSSIRTYLTNQSPITRRKKPVEASTTRAEQSAISRIEGSVDKSQKRSLRRRKKMSLDLESNRKSSRSKRRRRRQRANMTETLGRGRSGDTSRFGNTVAGKCYQRVKKRVERSCGRGAGDGEDHAWMRRRLQTNLDKLVKLDTKIFTNQNVVNLEKFAKKKYHFSNIDETHERYNIKLKHRFNLLQNIEENIIQKFRKLPLNFDNLKKCMVLLKSNCL